MVKMSGSWKNGQMVQKRKNRKKEKNSRQERNVANNLKYIFKSFFRYNFLRQSVLYSESESYDGLDQFI